MNKYSQDIFGIIRGIQLVANASLKTQEAYVKSIWSHSSVRDAIDKNIKQTTECGKKVIENPSQEFQNLNSFFKESFERSSVVLDGFRQYMSNRRSSMPIGSVNISDDQKIKSYSSIKNIKDLDIASITLKELENLLAEHNKIRDVNLRIDDDFKAKKPRDEKTVEIPSPPAVKVDTVARAQVEPKPAPSASSFVEDEKQVENMMKFITNYDKTPVPEGESVKKSAVPEVSA